MFLSEPSLDHNRGGVVSSSAGADERIATPFPALVTENRLNSTLRSPITPSVDERR